MAVIKAFRGMRYNTDKAGEISTLCCPPYDIISADEAHAYVEENQYNVIRLELPENRAYSSAAEVLKQWLDEGILLVEDRPAIYIYEEEFYAYGERRSVKGIIARVRLEEFSKGIILPHEFTLSKAKEDRLKLMKATNCNFSQIYALYSDDSHSTDKTIDEQSQTPAKIEFTDGDGVTHRLWIITDEDVIAKLCADFADRKLYIADGHHRYETALNYRNYCREKGISKEGDPQDYQMIYLVDMGRKGLTVFPTHRLIRNIAGFNKNDVLEKCAGYFDIMKTCCSNSLEAAIDSSGVKSQRDVTGIETELSKLSAKGEKAFGFYCGDGDCYILKLRNHGVMKQLLPQLSEASQNLDVSVLHTLVLERIFGIDKENMAKQKNLTYTKYFSEAVSRVDSGEFQCSFVLNPTKVEEIRDVAAAGEKMPQKSTYFYPKMTTGLVMNNLSIE